MPKNQGGGRFQLLVRGQVLVSTSDFGRTCPLETVQEIIPCEDGRCFNHRIKVGTGLYD